MQKTKLKLKTLNRNIAGVHKLLQKKLKTYNVSKINNYQRKHTVFSCCYGKKLLAGLYAYQDLGIFYIDLLWIDESYRHQGLGSNLLKTAEKYATKNKALYIRVNTGSFQAPRFYLKNNYEQFAKLPLVTTTKQKHYDYYFVKYLKQTHSKLCNYKSRKKVYLFPMLITHSDFPSIKLN